ncbi:MAG TPA: O-antigen ligase family protein [candidate division Zixibacteria bacterium]|nr:O-antigen ligase family protein [candidate division Zixibacteria bacterium]
MNHTEAQGLTRALAFTFLVFVVGSTFSIALAQIALGVSLLLFLIVMIRDRSNPFAGELKNIYWLIGALLAWYIIAAMVGGTPLKSLNTMREAWLFCVIPIGAAVMQRPDYQRLLLRCFVLAVLVISIYGILQYVFGLNWFKSTPLQEAPGFGFKVRGNFTHRLTFGNYYGTAAAFLLGLGLLPGNNLDRRHRFLILLTAGLAALATVLTFSRTVAAGMVIVAVLAGLLTRKRAAIALISIVAAVGLAAWLAIPGLSNRFVGDSTRDLSTDYEGSRLFVWSNTASIISDNPIFGVGPGNFPEEYAARLRPDIPEYRKLPHAHNDLLDVAAQTGIPGALLFAALWLTVLWRQFRNFRQGINPTAQRLALAGLLGSLLFLISSATEATFSDEEVRQLLMFLWATGLPIWYKNETDGLNVIRETS